MGSLQTGSQVGIAAGLIMSERTDYRAPCWGFRMSNYPSRWAARAYALHEPIERRIAARAETTLTPYKLAFALFAEYTFRTLWTEVVHDAVFAEWALVT